MQSDGLKVWRKEAETDQFFSEGNVKRTLRWRHCKAILLRTFDWNGSVRWTSECLVVPKRSAPYVQIVRTNVVQFVFLSAFVPIRHVSCPKRLFSSCCLILV